MVNRKKKTFQIFRFIHLYRHKKQLKIKWRNQSCPTEIIKTRIIKKITFWYLRYGTSYLSYVSMRKLILRKLLILIENTITGTVIVIEFQIDLWPSCFAKIANGKTLNILAKRSVIAVRQCSKYAWINLDLADPQNWTNIQKL